MEFARHSNRPHGADDSYREAPMPPGRSLFFWSAQLAKPRHLAAMARLSARFRLILAVAVATGACAGGCSTLNRPVQSSSHRDEQHVSHCCHCPSSKRRAGGEPCGLRIGRNRTPGAAHSRPGRPASSPGRPRRRSHGRRTRSATRRLAGAADRHRSDRHGARVVIR